MCCLKIVAVSCFKRFHCYSLFLVVASILFFIDLFAFAALVNIPWLKKESLTEPHLLKGNCVNLELFVQHGAVSISHFYTLDIAHIQRVYLGWMLWPERYQIKFKADSGWLSLGKWNWRARQKNVLNPAESLEEDDEYEVIVLPVLPPPPNVTIQLDLCDQSEGSLYFDNNGVMPQELVDAAIQTWLSELKLKLSQVDSKNKTQFRSVYKSMKTMPEFRLMQMRFADNALTAAQAQQLQELLGKQQWSALQQSWQLRTQKGLAISKID